MVTYIFDWKRTLYNPDSAELIDGATEVLKYVSHLHDSRLILIGKGGDDMQAEVERFRLENYFADIKFQEGEKDVALFADFVNPDAPRKTIFIGDRTRSELAVGNVLGAVTIWVKQGKFSDELPEDPMYVPTHTVISLSDLLKLLKDICE